jgi:hypothetical protein
VKQVICATFGVAATLALGAFGPASAEGSGASVAHQGSAAYAVQPAKKGNCYSNNNPKNDSGIGVVSQNFSDDDTLDSAGVTDFAVKKTCHVTGVDATGVYYNGIGPADSEVVTFYADEDGAPGSVLSSQTVAGVDNGGSFVMPLDDVAIPPGRAWVSVVANMSFSTGGEWGWELSTQAKRGSSSLWENPDDGFGTGCTTWGPVGTCVGFDGDFMITLTKG